MGLVAEIARLWTKMRCELACWECGEDITVPAPMFPDNVTPLCGVCFGLRQGWPIQRQAHDYVQYMMWLVRN